jgi:hypothetical protein
MGYESLVGQADAITLDEVSRITQRMMALGDPRDVLAARDSVIRLLCNGRYV